MDSSSTRAASEDATATILANVRRAYDRGDYRKAAEIGDALGELRAWPSAEGRVLAARLASRTGRPRLAQALLYRARREHPSEAEPREFWAGIVLARRGPRDALDFLRSRPDHASFPRMRACEAVALAMLRDFERADAAIADALAAEPHHPWMHVEHAAVLELSDRVDEALNACERARELVDGYPPSLLSATSMLAHLGRHDEALALLRHPRVSDSYELLWQRAAMRLALGDVKGADADLAASRSTLVAPEKRMLDSLALQRCETLYLLGDYRASAAEARAVGSPRALALAGRLDALELGKPAPRRELVSVPHVRQRHVTCAPASIASIARFHGDPLDHLSIAGEICYAGTPGHHSRAYVESRGFHAREFDVDQASARALVDAGLPFVLTTVATTTAHAQVVIGYDLVRECLLIRDPSFASLVEIAFDTLTNQAFHGPRGLVFVPASRSSELDAMTLPGSDLWERRQRLSLALDRHDVRSATLEKEAIEAAAPGSVHAHAARLELGGYLHDKAAQFAALDALIGRFAKALCHVLSRASLMLDAAPRAETIAYLRSYEASSDPAILEMLADLVRHEPEHRGEAARLLRRVRRLDRGSGSAHHILADLQVADEHDPRDVLESYRFGACLSEANEHHARAYYDYAARHGEESTALAFLEARVHRAEHRSAAPATTLFQVHADAGNPELGIAALERLAARRPNDGDLLLTVVEAHLAVGDPGGASRALHRASGLPAREDERLAVSAKLAQLDGRLEEADRLLEEACAMTRDRADLVAERARLRASYRGPEEARAVLESALERRPHDGEILRQLCIFLRGREDQRAIELLKAQLERFPDDLWSRRELAADLYETGRKAEAHEVISETIHRQPQDVVARLVRGSILEQDGDVESARLEYRRAIELDVDAAQPIEALARLPADPETQREDARFVLDLIESRRASGPGIAEAAHLALCLPASERHERLERILAHARHHPDAYEGIIGALLVAGRYDEAATNLDEAIARFPRWFRLREQHARLFELRGDEARQREVLLALLADAPHLGRVRVALARNLSAKGAHEAALTTVEQGLRIAPRSAELIDARAAALIALGRRDEAFVYLLDELRNQTLGERGYSRLLVCAERLQRQDEVESVLSEQVRRDPKASHPWRRLAFLFEDMKRGDDTVAALREALARSPRDLDAIDQLAVALCDAGRYDEALAASPPAGWSGPVPMTMRGRHAWVRAKQGRTDEAIRLAEAILAETPAYEWLRTHLCDWLDAGGKPVAFLEHAKMLAEHSPSSARSHVYLGDAQLANGERSAAIESFARALELDPGYAHAANRIASLLLVDRDLGRAKAVFERIRHSLDASDASAFEVRIAAKEGRSSDAIAALGRMLEHPSTGSQLGPLVDEMADTPMLEDALARIEPEMFATDPAAGSEIGRTYASLLERHAPAKKRRLLARISELGPAGEIACSAMIEELGRKRDRLGLLAIFLRERNALVARVWLWGALGYSLLVVGLPWFARGWLSRGLERPDARPWMLLNLVLASLRTGQVALARRAAIRASRLQRDHTSDRHARWVLMTSLLDGSVDRAADAIASLPCGADLPEMQLEDLARAVEHERSLPTSMGPMALLDALRPELETLALYAGKHGELRGIYLAALETMVARRGLLARLWFWLRAPRP